MGNNFLYTEKPRDFNSVLISGRDWLFNPTPFNPTLYDSPREKHPYSVLF